MNNPEDKVIDEIDRLVDESLAHGPTDDFNRNWLVECSRCGGEWHGLPIDDCPGDEEPRTIQDEGAVYPQWMAVVPGAPYVNQVESVRFHGTAMDINSHHGYTLEDIAALRDLRWRP